jgi:hypothetical protein
VTISFLVGSLNENPINHKKHTDLAMPSLATSDNSTGPTYIVDLFNYLISFI